MEDSLGNIRHSLAHLLAAAVLDLFPNAKPSIGPAIEDGFYYDFDNLEISDKDLSRIEEKMKESLPSWQKFEHKEVSEKEAKDFFKNNIYKLELIDEIKEKGEKITFYSSGEFTDLCRGGHVSNPSKEIDLGAFKLDRIAGAYWRGDEKNKMLTRIYGLAFGTKADLENYILQREDAQKRDHRKIGQEQELFFIDDMVGKGLVIWLPKGNILKNEVEKLAIKFEDGAGYQRVTTPHIAKEELFLTSGHLPYYKDGMYPAMEMDDGIYYLKAMNCPLHHRIYLNKPRSYRDLPLRLAEYGTVYRNERSGTLAGLLRVRGLDMNDAHIYCMKDQIKEEFKSVMNLTMEYFKIFGLENYWFRLSKWDPKETDKYVNEPANWEYSEATIREVLKEMKVKFVEADNEAAFYGPKVDVQFRSVGGREETMSTIQLDFVAKQRFGLSYTDKEGKENNEVFVIHRAPLSTHERFTAFLIEHYGGIFPFWLSPVQVKILSVGENFNKYGKEIYEKLKANNIRAEFDDSNETLGKKVRKAKIEKVPYWLVLGSKEEESQTIAVESRDQGKLGQKTLEEFLEIFKK